MTTIRRKIGYPANDPISESALDKHNAENDLYRVLNDRATIEVRAQVMAVTSHGVVPIEQARMYAERAAREKANEQGWREGLGQWNSPHRMAADPCARCRELGVCQRSDCGGPSARLPDIPWWQRWLHKWWPTKN